MNAARRRTEETRTPAETLMRGAQEALASGARMLSMSLALAACVLLGVLFLDIPLWAADRFFETAALAPSNWMRLGDVFMALSVYGVLLISRRYGAETAGRAVMTTWTLVAIVVIAVIVIMAPQLEAGDLPSARFAAVFALSWFAGHLVGAHMFDLARTTVWWRAPLIGALWAFYLQSGLFFAGQFFGASLPWPNWMMTDLVLKTGVAFIYLPIYASLRRSIPPRPGYGGR